MPRMKSAVTREDIPAEGQEYYDRIIGERGRLSGPVAQLLPFVPDLAERFSNLGGYVRFKTVLSKAQTELTTIAAARALDNAYIWASHVPPALEEGVAMETVDIINKGDSVEGLAADEALLVRMARQYLDDRFMDDVTFEEAKARFGEAGILEIAALVGFYSMVSCIIVSAQFTPRDGAPPLIKR